MQTTLILAQLQKIRAPLNLKSVMFIRLISLWLKSFFFVSNVPPRYHAFVF